MVESWYQRNKERILKKQKQYHKEHQDEKREYQKKYDKEHKNEKLAYNRKWKKNNPDKVRQSVRKWTKKNRDKQRKYMQQWYQDNKERIYEQRQDYDEPESVKQKRAEVHDIRNRNMKRILLIPDVLPCKTRWHHVHDWFIVPVPEGFHKGAEYGNKHREELNKVIKWLYNVDIKELIT